MLILSLHKIVCFFFYGTLALTVSSEKFCVWILLSCCFYEVLELIRNSMFDYGFA